MAANGKIKWAVCMVYVRGEIARAVLGDNRMFRPISKLPVALIQQLGSPSTNSGAEKYSPEIGICQRAW